MFVVAELSGNHGQSFDEAVKLVRMAKEAWAPMRVKLQTYTADTLTIPGDREWFTIKGGMVWGTVRTLHNLYEESLPHAVGDG